MESKEKNPEKNTTEEEKEEEVPTVPIFIMGKRYDVPDSLTIQKAMEYAGYQLIRGCGCRGGICGACGTVYRFPTSPRIEVGLACQTIVQPNMYLTQIPFFPVNKATYNIEDLQPSVDEIVRQYPDILKCMGCNTCTKSCTMDIEVMEYISAALRGDVERAARLSFDCVMCGLCTARCPAEIGQYNIGILCRRLFAKHIIPKSEHLAQRVEEIKAGKFTKMLGELKEMDKEALMKVYSEREIEPDLSEEYWDPSDKSHL